MSNSIRWDILPATDLTVQANWRRVDKDRYLALRIRVMIVCSEENEYRDGAVISSHPVFKDTIQLRVKRQQVISESDTIYQAVQFSTSKRILGQLTANISSELATKVPGFSGKLGSSLMSKAEYEITQTTATSLSTTNSFMIQETTEEEHTITLNAGDTPRTANLRMRYWPRRWDVYLHSYEALELTYKRKLLWKRIRKSMRSAEPEVVGWPLVSILFFEPQADQVVTYDPVPNELRYPDIIEIREPVSPMPDFRPPKIDDLDDLAKLAFPYTKEEKAKAKQRKIAGVKRVPAKKAAKRSPVRRAAKKAAAKKAAAKKTSAKKAPAKKASLKRMAKKAAVKRSAKKAARR